MKNLYRNLVTISILLSAFVAVGQIQYSNEYWISTNSAASSLGTLDEPFDGSTQSKFDAIMNNLPPYCTIHIMAGTYQTLGNFGWGPKSGQKILGSGIDVTILQFPASAVSAGTVDDDAVIANGYPYNITNTEVSDMTLDCNYQSGSTVTLNGINIFGTELAIRRVKVIHNAKYSNSNSESWGILIAPGSLAFSKGNIIEECEVSQYEGGIANLSAIATFGNISAVIKNNRVIGTPDAFDDMAAPIFAYGIAGAGILLEGNYAEWVNCGVHSDTASSTNIIISHNFFNYCGYGVDHLAGGTLVNYMCDFNNIIVTNLPDGSGAQAFYFGNTIYPTMCYTNITVFGNTATYLGSETTANFISIVGCSGLTVANNSIDSSLNKDLVECTNVNMYNNVDLMGNYLPNFNIPTVGNMPVSPLGFNLIGGSQGTVLTDLGLSSDPSTIITNDETQPVTLESNLTVNGNLSVSGTASAAQFIGGGADLTGLNASQLTSGTEPLSVVNPAVSTNQTFFILPPDGYLAQFTGGSIVAQQYELTGILNLFGWYCPSNANAAIDHILPSPYDYFGGKVNFVSSWNILTTNAGTFSFNIGEYELTTINSAGTYDKTVTFTAPAGTNCTWVSVTNTIPTGCTNFFGTSIYIGNQVQPGNYLVLSGKINAQ